MAPQIGAFIFDMDGTLVDSEDYSGRAIESLAAEQGLGPRPVERSRFEGVTWNEAEAAVVEVYPELTGKPLARKLQELFNDLLLQEPPRLIGGAEQALTAASQAMPTALVSSSNRDTVQLLLGRRGLLDRFQVIICAEDCTRSKPDPECYLKAAQRLGCWADRCLVFEDSIVGLQAAGAAGLRTMAIARGRRGQAAQKIRCLADAWIDDFTALEPGFFAQAGALTT